MKDKPKHIATHVTGAIERLSDENLSGEELALEINRAKSIASLGSAYVGINRLYIDAFTAAHNADLNPTRIPGLIESTRRRNSPALGACGSSKTRTLRGYILLPSGSRLDPAQATEL